MSETSWQSSTWTHATVRAPWLVLVAGDGDFLSLVETAKRLGAKVAVAAWRRSVHDDLVETADAFLALDDDDVVWNESDEERTTTTRAARPRSRRRAAPRAGAAVDQWFAFWRGGADAARSRRRAVARARGVGAAGAARRGDGKRRWRRRACAALAESARQQPSRSASAQPGGTRARIER